MQIYGKSEGDCPEKGIAPKNSAWSLGWCQILELPPTQDARVDRSHMMWKDVEGDEMSLSPFFYNFSENEVQPIGIQ